MASLVTKRQLSCGWIALAAPSQVAQLQPFDQYDSPFTHSGHEGPLERGTDMRMLPVGIILIPPVVHV